MLQVVHHLQITIPFGSEDEARAFYSGILGLKEIPKPESLAKRGGFWLELGETQIHIGIEDDNNRANSKAHVGYLVKDLESWRTMLIENNVTIVDGIPIPNYCRFEFRDPFGNRIEFLEQTDNG